MKSPSPKAPTLAHSIAQRIAIAENMRIVQLLTESAHPEAKNLAVIVLERIRAIDEGRRRLCGEPGGFADDGAVRAADHRSGGCVMAWPVDWDRGLILGAIEEASGVSLSADDSLPDTLIAQAQAIGISPVDLKLWIYDKPDHPWTAENLACWARDNGFLCGHCGERVTDPEAHTCGGER